MGEETPRYGLPFILPGQAQKEIFHNEALTLLDAALHPAVEGAPAVAPPAEPALGACWIVASGGAGAWAGKDHNLACWTDGGWRFVAPPPGMLAWNKTADLWLHWDGAAWSDGALPASALRIGGVQVVGERQPSLPSPSGGTVIDVEARAAINAILATLMSHGLTD
jgi:hypothetical protein